MPTQTQVRQLRGAGFLGDILGGIHSAVKDSGVLSKLVGKIPIVGGLGGGLVKQLGYGKRKKRAPKKVHHGAGILGDLIGMVGLGHAKAHKGRGRKTRSVIKT